MGGLSNASGVASLWDQPSLLALPGAPWGEYPWTADATRMAVAGWHHGVRNYPTGGLASATAWICGRVTQCVLDQARILVKHISVPKANPEFRFFPFIDAGFQLSMNENTSTLLSISSIYIFASREREREREYAIMPSCI